jgi:hypothetical protein
MDSKPLSCLKRAYFRCKKPCSQLLFDRGAHQCIVRLCALCCTDYNHAVYGRRPRDADMDAVNRSSYIGDSRESKTSSKIQGTRNDKKRRKNSAESSSDTETSLIFR